jgi:hypothetical protein
LRLTLTQKRDYFDVLVSYLVPLQALLDFTLDDESHFNVTQSAPMDHQCKERAYHNRHFDSYTYRSCNKLCFLTPEAKKKLLDIEDEINEVIALQA